MSFRIKKVKKLTSRILLIIDGLPGGGAEKVVLTLARGFIACGHQVSLFSLRSVCDYTLPPGIDYQVVLDRCKKPWRKLTELNRRARLLDAAVHQAEQSAGKFDLIISHLHKTDRIVSRCKNLDPQRTWYCIHGVFSASYLSRRTGLSRWLKILKTRRTYQQRNIVGVSRYVLEDLKKAYNIQPSREMVIHNPFDIAHIRQMAQEPVEMADRSYLLHIGRFHQTKRHDRLLQAYAQSDLTLPLVLIGQGNPEKIKELEVLAESLHIRERVIFKGFTHNPYAWIKHAAMLVASSDSEGFGNVLVEALICQTPVVSTRCPGGPEEILQGDLARCLSELDPSALAARLVEIYHHPPDLENIDLSSYDVHTICQRYLSLIDTTHETVKME